MSNFRFGLQKVLELRRRLEKESARKLSEARVDAAVALEVVQALEQVRQASAEQVSSTGNGVVPAGELQRLALIVSTLDDHLEVANDTSDEADAKVTGLSSEFQSAHADRRALDILKEKHRALWNAQEEKRDRALLDAVALARHVRRAQEK
jgi:flagellar export protein FliJ